MSLAPCQGQSWKENTNPKPMWLSDKVALLFPAPVSRRPSPSEHVLGALLDVFHPLCSSPELLISQQPSSVSLVSEIGMFPLLPASLILPGFFHKAPTSAIIALTRTGATGLSFGGLSSLGSWALLVSSPFEGSRISNEACKCFLTSAHLRK